VSCTEAELLASWTGAGGLAGWSLSHLL